MILKPIQDLQLVEHLKSLHPDGMTIFLLADAIRGAFFHGSRFVNTMRAQHELGILETMVLGQAALCAALLIPSIKGHEHLTFRYDTRGPAAGFSVQASSEGSVRGYLFQDPIPLTTVPESWDLAPFFGDGTLSLIRHPEGSREPVTGTIEIKYRNIARDLAEYFYVSEQIPTGFNTGIQLDSAGRVIGAGGLFLQVMPGADPELLPAVENAFSAAPSLGQWFAEGGDREDIIHGLFRSFKPAIVLERTIFFDCQCSREGFARHLVSLGRDEVEDMLKTGPDPIEVYCHNCGSLYRYPVSEICALVESLKKG